MVSRSERQHRPVTVFALLVLAMAGACLAFLALWVAEGLAPVTESGGVVGHVSDGEGDRGPSDGYDEFEVEVRTGDGAVHLGERGPLLVPLQLGDPVVVARSAPTGRVVSVRGPDGEVDLHAHAGMIVLVGVAAAGTAGAVWQRRRLVEAVGWGLPSAGVSAPVLGAAVTVLGAVAVLAALVVPETPEGDRWTVDGMGVYESPKYFPETVVPRGRDVDLQEVVLRVRGPLVEGAPPGSPERLRGLRVLVVPMTARIVSADPGRYVRLELIGRGEGRPRLLRAADCGTAPGAFDGIVADGASEGGPSEGGSSEGGPSEGGPSERRVCFAVPPDFVPEYLVLDEKTAVRV
ncbi:hypothetical protein [Streptomyces sudanensis]|uniref:hypothetical protein n=1 Tax=Streptomyces sudanensis TaxID=436397 RepID=UPI0020CC40A7|nr:hypothetical protein [Streptomyces sudanensis]MCP9957522.1 hypothetical protein [Streptomyces sudanensis]MCQ0001933.1 hypothetical protein [Streptomyces sudanensis]